VFNRCELLLAAVGEWFGLRSDRRDSLNWLATRTAVKVGSTLPSPIWAVPDGDRLLFIFEEGSSTVAEVRKVPRVTVSVSNLRAEQLSDPVEATAAILDRSANDVFFRAMAKRHGLVGRWFNFCNKHRNDTVVVLELKAAQRLRSTRSQL
jgi:PPOX class probable F420-dependent enzyme